MSGGEVAKLIDHTLLRPEATRHDIEVLCREALDSGSSMSASIPPGSRWLRLLNTSGVGVCAVVGFPLGATTPDVKVCEARRTIADGAREIDMVINIGALKSGDRGAVQRDIEAVAAHPGGECPLQREH